MELKLNKEIFELNSQPFGEMQYDATLSQAIQQFVEKNMSAYDMNHSKQFVAKRMSDSDRSAYQSIQRGECSLYNYVLESLETLKAGRAAKLALVCHEQWSDWTEKDKQAWVEYVMRDAMQLFLELYRKYSTQKQQFDEMSNQIKRYEQEIEALQSNLEERLRLVEAERDKLTHDIKKYEAYVNYQVTRLNKALQ
ncbi:hypothetical protein NQ117_09660 [Paenibacillus sp. SC116]|uniref:hypothetical protein n=1 Tax=Paenibacillus sp. SC116 TaxID=2968986 RepID=UPI00215B62FF|nr:hypothetical protein [Paenibacillus sp. SC116]MCR8843954.1 hypothetical protein [Paenibacillus sp. SC116]